MARTEDVRARNVLSFVPSLNTKGRSAGFHVEKGVPHQWPPEQG